MSSSISDLIVYKDNQIIVFNKPCGIPVQKDKTNDKCLEEIASSYCKHPVQLVHRLDRPTSGLVLFAKNKKALAYFNKALQQQAINKKYLAIVKNKPEEKETTLTHWIYRDGRNHKARIVAKEHTKGKKAELNYKVIGQSDSYYLLEIQPTTGRFHQIRCQLSAIECPIKGDVKYGYKRGNKDRSIQLHAAQLRFKHPTSGLEITVNAPTPIDKIWAYFNTPFQSLNP